MWLICALLAVVCLVVNLIKRTVYLAYASISLAGLTVAALYQEAAMLASQQDWSGLEDILPSLAPLIWAFLVGAILPNALPLLLREKRG